jgi:hypothetical protein
MYDGFDNKMFRIEKSSYNFADDWFRIAGGLELDNTKCGRRRSATYRLDGLD